MIFLTGGSGFLGSRILAKLIGADINVCCIGRKYIPDTKNVRWIKLDLLESNFPDDLLKGCSYFIHCAGAIKGPRTVLERINYISTQKLLGLASKEKVKKFIFVSSIDSIMFNSTYAHTKRMAEEAVMGSGLNWVIIRPSQIFGLSDSKNFCLLSRLVKRLPIIPIPSGGRFGWEPVFVDDLAGYIVDTALKDNISNQALNIVGPEVISFHEIICILEKFSNVKKLKITIPSCIMNLFKKITAIVLGAHISDEIFLTFVDKVVPEDSSSKKVRLFTKFSQIFRNV